MREVKRQDEPEADEESKQDGKGKTIRVGARRPKRRKPPDPERPEQPSKKKRWPKLAPWSEDKKIVCLQENPKAKDKPSGVRYEKYKAAKTVREYLDLGGTKDDLRWDRRRSYVVAQGDGEALAAPTADLQDMFDVVVPEVEAARKRYARQSEAFHAEREAAGAAPPQELSHSVRMLPFWEAAVAAEPILDKVSNQIKACAQEAAMWRLFKVEEAKPSEEKEEAARVGALKRMVRATGERMWPARWRSTRRWRRARTWQPWASSRRRLAKTCGIGELWTCPRPRTTRRPCAESSRRSGKPRWTRSSTT